MLLITRPRLKVKFYTNNPDWDDVGGKLAIEQWYIKNPAILSNMPGLGIVSIKADGESEGSEDVKKIDR